MKSAAVVSPLLAVAALLPGAAVAASTPYKPNFQVLPSVSDPQNTKLVASEWKQALGCPGAELAYPGFSLAGFACIPGDPQDDRNQGLQMVKTGPTANPAYAAADLKGVKGTFLTELGYDLRKANFQQWISGSQCGGRAPRFEITMASGNQFFMVSDSYYIGCQFPFPDRDESTTLYWRRPRWGGSVTDSSTGTVTTFPVMACAGPIPALGTDLTTACVPVPISCPAGQTTCGLANRVEKIRIIFDVGQDTVGFAVPPKTDPLALEEFGLTVLDNIDVNGKLVGRGPNAAPRDQDEGQGRDKDDCEFRHRNSASQPETSGLEYDDPSHNYHLKSVNGARSIAYKAGPLGEPCVTFVGDAVVNGNAGYLYTFAACDLSVVGTDLGTYSISVTGPLGTLPYQKTASLVTGYVDIHK
jgi:hypothetical protein